MANKDRDGTRHACTWGDPLGACAPALSRRSYIIPLLSRLTVPSLFLFSFFEFYFIFIEKTRNDDCMPNEYEIPCLRVATCRPSEYRRNEVGWVSSHIYSTPCIFLVTGRFPMKAFFERVNNCVELFRNFFWRFQLEILKEMTK